MGEVRQGQARLAQGNLKHNLNAQAIGAIHGESLDIEKEVEQLIGDMNDSIAQAESFTRALP